MTARSPSLQTVSSANKYNEKDVLH